MAVVRLMGTRMDTVTIRQQSASTDEQEQMQLGSRKLKKQKKCYKMSEKIRIQIVLVLGVQFSKRNFIDFIFILMK